MGTQTIESELGILNLYKATKIPQIVFNLFVVFRYPAMKGHGFKGIIGVAGQPRRTGDKVDSDGHSGIS